MTGFPTLVLCALLITPTIVQSQLIVSRITGTAETKRWDNSSWKELAVSDRIEGEMSVRTHTNSTLWIVSEKSPFTNIVLGATEVRYKIQDKICRMELDRGSMAASLGRTANQDTFQFLAGALIGGIRQAEAPDIATRCLIKRNEMALENGNASAIAFTPGWDQSVVLKAGSTCTIEESGELSVSDSSPETNKWIRALFELPARSSSPERARRSTSEN